ncbi:MAG: GNAT family N-acetyltransferase [Dehalococcoidia bacterium]|nr:GNAT family N-acetyltransferase [Dehalococcoidia bacterium]
MAIKIRGIEARDKQQILELVRETGVFVPDEVDVAEEVINDYFKDRAGSGYFFYIAEYEGEVAGYICYGPTPMTHGAWDIYWIAVRPALHGQGVGSTLAKLAEKYIKSQGGRMALIETSSNPGYQSARSLYKTLGYEHVSTIPDFYNPGDNKETFRKVL